MHCAYADSLSEYGEPCHLKNSDCWILVSPIINISDLPVYDARSCYPLFSCRYWSLIPQDLEVLENKLVSLMVVTDPFGDYNTSVLQKCFPDLFRPYKNHYVIDLTLSPDKNISEHHARNVRKAKDKIHVDHVGYPLDYLHEWNILYSNLIVRHGIKGIAAFSARSFEKQLQVPGLEMFRATYNRETVGIMLMFEQGNVGYYHLSAYNEMGYKYRASYALIAYIIEYYSTRLRWISLGAGAGIHDNQNDGLTRFKKGWATETRTTYIGGRIFNRVLYNELVRDRGLTGNSFFPLYRQGEI
jgi:hypothetical protein